MNKMSEKKYIDVTNYQDCKIVLHNEDEGIRIKDIPTADVEEVRHGEWLENGANYKCSVCGNTESYYSDSYCRVCGAKMDGGKE